MWFISQIVIEHKPKISSESTNPEVSISRALTCNRNCYTNMYFLKAYEY